MLYISIETKKYEYWIKKNLVTESISENLRYFQSQ